MVHGLTEAVIRAAHSTSRAAIDFPEEKIDFLADHELGARFEAVRDHFEGVLEMRARPVCCAEGHDGGHRRPAGTPASRACSTGFAGYDRRS